MNPGNHQYNKLYIDNDVTRINKIFFGEIRFKITPLCWKSTNSKINNCYRMSEMNDDFGQHVNRWGTGKIKLIDLCLCGPVE